MAQSLIESGHLEGTRGAYRLVTPIERLEVPATVQAVLAARIDRLPEREKRLLQVASVIGKDFPEPLLAEVAELPADELKAALAALRRAEFIHEQAIYPVAEYAFKHPLTQEVALGSQLESDAARCTPRWRARSSSRTPSISTNAPRCWRTTGRRPARRSAPRAGTGARPSGWGAPTSPPRPTTGGGCARSCASFRTIARPPRSASPPAGSF